MEERSKGSEHGDWGGDFPLPWRQSQRWRSLIISEGDRDPTLKKKEITELQLIQLTGQRTEALIASKNRFIFFKLMKRALRGCGADALVIFGVGEVEAGICLNLNRTRPPGSDEVGNIPSYGRGRERGRASYSVRGCMGDCQAGVSCEQN